MTAPNEVDRNARAESPMRPGTTLSITLPIAATSVLLLVAGAAASWYVHHRNHEVTHVLANRLECALASEQLVLALRDVRREFEWFVHTGEATHLQEAVGLKEITSRSLSDVERAAGDERVAELVNRIRRGHDRFFTKLAAAPSSSGTRSSAMNGMLEQLNAELLAPSEELLAYNRHTVADYRDRSQTMADRVGLGFLALGVCGSVGGLFAGFAVARNITMELERREREAARAEQLAAMGRLAAGLAHELRNPLTSMKILVQAAAEQKDGAGLSARDMEVLEEEIHRLEQLVKSFLDFARPPAIKRSTFDLHDLISQVVRLAAAQAAQRHVVLEYHPPGQPITVDVDPIQIRQVLLNLLINALDVTPQGGTIAIDVRTWDGRSEGSVIIRVSDTGPGIPANVMDRIFQPFVSTKDTGTGLGLAVSYRIVEAHGGVIDVANREQGGAQFTIRLPRASREQKRGGSAEPCQATGSRRTESSESIR